MKNNLPYIIRPPRSTPLTLMFFFGLIPILCGIYIFFAEGKTEFFNLVYVILFFPVLGLILGIFLCIIKITVYPDHISYRYSLIFSPKEIYFRDIKQIKRLTKVLYGGIAPALEIISQEERPIEIPIGSLNNKDVSFLIEIVKDFNSNAILNDYAEQSIKNNNKAFFQYIDFPKGLIYFIILAFLGALVTFIIK